MAPCTHVKHTFEPVYDERSEVLILGSLPSVQSRAQGFYYGHAQNRFWRVLAALLAEKVPQTIDEKKAFLLRNHIALWDVIAECDITGSSDSSIRNAVPADIAGLLEKTNIRALFVNGGTAYRLYMKYISPQIGLPVIQLPSTSPANAAWTLDRLLGEWRAVAAALHQADRPVCLPDAYIMKQE